MPASANPVGRNIFKDGFRMTLHWVFAADQYAYTNTWSTWAARSPAASDNNAAPAPGQEAFHAIIPATEVTPFSLDGGGEINLVTMLSKYMRTKWHKQLKGTEALTMNAFFSFNAFHRALSLVNANYQMKLKFPDNSYILFYASMNQFKPNSFKEGEPPSAMISVVPTHINEAGIETTPVFWYAGAANEQNLGNYADDNALANPRLSWF